MENKKKKIALFGGSFNPVHNEHVNVVKETLKAGLVDEVWMMPIMQHQFDWALVDSEIRIEMLEAAFKGIPSVKICREEIDFPGMSDQYNTIKRLKKKYNHEFIWLGGSDLFGEVRRWFKRGEIFEMIDFIIFERQGYPIIEFDGMNVLKILSVGMNNISSTQIRLRKEEGESIHKFVPVEVEKIIREKGVYLKISPP
jgi:nicotinate-nucleotide adenylyltransferase